MREFYRLCGIRRPEFMGWSQVELDKKKYQRGLSPMQDTEFAADEFGNELERYLVDYKKIRKTVEEAEKILHPELKDAFFAAVKYPVFCASAMAEKTLQAQEARHFARPEAFNIDDEALEAAVRSWKAYQEILSLTDYYNNKMSDGKWRGSMDCAPRKLPVFGEPVFPGKLTEENIQRYADAEPVKVQLQADNCIARNACSWTKATQGARVIDMLGHSMSAVALPRGGKLSYDFSAAKSDSCLLYVGVVPTQPNDKGDIRFSVSIDGQQPTVISIKEPFRSENWKRNVMRGQAFRKIPVWVAYGSHTLTIEALDDNIIVDQWMIDYDKNRSFYMVPVGE